MANSTETFREALAAYNNRDFNRAEGLFRRVIEADKSNVPALNLLVVVLMGMKRFAEAEPYDRERCVVVRTARFNAGRKRICPSNMRRLRSSWRSTTTGSRASGKSLRKIA